MFETTVGFGAALHHGLDESVQCRQSVGSAELQQVFYGLRVLGKRLAKVVAAGMVIQLEVCQQLFVDFCAGARGRRCAAQTRLELMQQLSR
jgi:hypothetical protein